MKSLFENWRKHIIERIDYIPPKKQPEFDVGTTFTKITVDGIINNKYTSSMEQATIIELLELFNKLHAETDITEMKIILKAIRTMSGNSEDFSFLADLCGPLQCPADYDNVSEEDLRRAKQHAREFYITPNRLVAHPKDKKPTKSLKDWHDHLKTAQRRRTRHMGWQDRGEKDSDFYSSSDYYHVQAPVDPFAATEKKSVEGGGAREKGMTVRLEERK